MAHLERHRTGLIVGVFLGMWHALWATLVWTGWGQVLIDFILWAHMVHLPYIVGPFDLKAAVTLVIVTAVIGYVIGFAFSLVWNSLSRSKV